MSSEIDFGLVVNGNSSVELSSDESNDASKTRPPMPLYTPTPRH